MLGTAAELDFILKDAGVQGVFSRGATILASPYGLLDLTQLVQPAQDGLDIVGRETTFTVRDGTTGGAKINDTVTIAGVAYRIRDLGVLQANGTRVLQLAGG